MQCQELTPLSANKLAFVRSRAHGPRMSDFPQLSGGGLVLDDFRFVVYGYLWKTRCSVDCLVLELLQLFSLRKL